MFQDMLGLVVGDFEKKKKKKTFLLPKISTELYGVG